MFSKPRSAADLAVWGLTPDDFAGHDDCEVWPDVWPAVQAFEAVPASAWQVDPDYTVKGASADQRFTVFGGPVGVRPEAWRDLRYSLGINGQQWRDMYPDIRVLEAEAVHALRTRSA